MTLDEQLEAVFQDHFNDPALELTDDTTAADIPGWDSLAHISLVFRLEEEFDVMFASDEAMTLANVGDLKRLLKEKVG